MKIEPTRLFEQQVKWLTKKYPSLAHEVPAALLPLANNQLESFDAMPKGFYKIRVPIASKGVGKRSGARIVAHVRIVEDKAFLVSIYDKSDFDNISDDVLKGFLKENPTK